MPERIPQHVVFAVLSAALVVVLLGALAVGSAEQVNAAILWEIRLPRVILAALVGSGLACAGALLQPLLQNPLADPYLLGISGGAALGGVAALTLGEVAGTAAWLGSVTVPVVAFAGALLATALLYAIAGTGGGTLAGASAGTRLLLCGVVFNAFASALMIFMLSAVELDRIAVVFLWLIGSIRYVDPWLILGVFAALALSIWVGVREAYALNLMTQGDEVAAHLGVEVRAVRRRILLATALMVGAAVSVAGLVGFVGLVIPHLLRLCVGADNRVIVPASALFGAIFLVIADTLARSVLAPNELPVGAFSAAIGGPVFLFLLRRQLVRSAP